MISVVVLTFGFFFNVDMIRKYISINIYRRIMSSTWKYADSRKYFWVLFVIFTWFFFPNVKYSKIGAKRISMCHFRPREQICISKRYSNANIYKTRFSVLGRVPHKVKTQYAHCSLISRYFLFPWRNPAEMTRRSILFHN